MVENRGIRIPLKRDSWELITEVLTYLVEKPHLDDLEERRDDMEKLDPWAGWRPPTREYDPNDPHFDPFHPPKNTPDEVLKAFWGDDEEDDDGDEQSEA